MDTETFKKVFLPYHQKLYRVAYRIVQNTANAEDIVQ
ncbi:MAG: RNA polymerase subunit sigma-70, partial [Prevotella sp.]|nr:RNA polymerase subunit sigma-70 [Prevotella sp.]